MKKLPIGTQSFEKLRTNNCVYVDKTEIIHRIISNGEVYCLSRPRRFGKSLLVSTLEALFKGRKELFEGLYIYDRWDWSQQYPVIVVDWAMIGHSTPEEMKTDMISYLNEIARDSQITLTSQFISGCFRELIKSLHDQSGKKVAVLIDEYDKPVTAHLFDSHLTEIRTAVHDFYQVMKGTDKFGNYWIRTGTPTFLLDIIRRRNRTDAILEPIVVGESILDGYNPPDIREAPLLFQTGYLTVKHKELNRGIPSYTLDIPNSEVNEGLMTGLLEAYGKYSSLEWVDDLRMTMARQITAGDEAGFAISLEATIATVLKELHGANESCYHTIMLIWMRLLGFKIHGEMPNDRGRADAVWEQHGVTVIAELKYHAKKKTNALLNDAMTQIRERRYYNRYTGKVILPGIAFSGKDVGCRMEELKRTCRSSRKGTASGF
ncbi:MAG: AAA family ATPase [Tannerella sp.]|jgi:hypothetical protein|nr:AAA family ATPase [Tannerella sp.]